MTLRKVSGRKRERAASLFKYFNQFTEAEPNGLDVLILDEAHRTMDAGPSLVSAGRTNYSYTVG